MGLGNLVVRVLNGVADDCVEIALDGLEGEVGRERLAGVGRSRFPWRKSRFRLYRKPSLRGHDSWVCQLTSLSKFKSKMSWDRWTWERVQQAAETRRRLLAVRACPPDKRRPDLIWNRLYGRL